MPYVRKLVGSRTYLSPLSHDDAELMFRWHNDLEAIFLAQGPGLRSPGTTQEFREFIDTFHQRKWPILMIVDLETDQPIGWCSLWNVRPAQSQAEVAIIIGEHDHWGQGYGSDAMRLLLDYGFNLMNLNSIELVTGEHNTRAIRCYEKVGFKHVGRRRQGHIHGNRKTDVILMDYLAEEFVSPYVIPTIEQATKHS
ncbi:GNAT family N-acetyltransferase [Candidatus Bipolaricaulota bacterium]|nr:GNAT family N-acetyltransferase [Candidatus Bipolaricaulota bacterium]